MQNADSYRQQNASVVSTVKEGQQYSATTEVVANHNHCHSLTMMYFEVLRHYAIYQELANVEECVFVPLLMTNFTPDNIFKWRDVLAQNLLPLPSNTYLPAVDGQHPLARAFDANERILANWQNVDYPTDRFADDTITSIIGSLQLRVKLPRPQTRYDRILSFPLIEKKEGGPSFWDVIKNAIVAPFTGGIPVFGTDERTVQVRSKIFDSFMTLEANYETVPPAQCIRVTNFHPILTSDAAMEQLRAALAGFIDTSKVYKLSGPDFFDGNKQDKQAWEAYASILDYDSVFDFLHAFFHDELICDWDRIFYDSIVPALYEKLVKKLKLQGMDNAGNPVDGIQATFTSLGHYSRGEVTMGLNIYGTTAKARAALPPKLVLKAPDVHIQNLIGLITLRLETLSLSYSTAHFSNRLYAGYLGQDVETGAVIDIPLTEADMRNPHKEDRFIVSRLVDHLNSNLEYYNKVLWYNLDADRRYMLLDGFNVQVFNDFGVPIGLKSLASVIKNDLITVAGNSMVFPVSPGFKVSRSYLVEKTATGTTERVDLMEHYKPLTPPPPYRVSVPTKGLFVEAVKGMCDSCEKVEANTSQDWNVFKADEPTAINALTAPTPTVTDWKATFKDIAAATVGMQTAPTAPAVGAGLTGLSEALTKADTFRDVTGLAANQANAASTYKANLDAATKMAEIAKGLATQEHNTDKSSQIMDKLKEAKDSGAISKEDYSKLVKQHLEQQIDGGDTQRAKAKATEEATKAAAASSGPSLSGAAVDAAGKGIPVKATKTTSDGTVESVEINGAGTGTATKSADDAASASGVIEAMGGDEAKDNDIWAVCATMMMNWKQQKSMSVPERVKTFGDKYVTLYNDDKGIKTEEGEAFLKPLGMTAEGPAEYTAKQYVEWLNAYGPLWLALVADEGELSPAGWIITAITGAAGSDDAKTKLTINEPVTGKQVTVSLADFKKEYRNSIVELEDNADYSTQVIHFTAKRTDTGTGGDKPGTGGGDMSKYVLDTDKKYSYSNARASFRKLKDDTVVFFKGILSVDVDGAPKAYHAMSIEEFKRSTKSRDESESTDGLKGLDHIWAGRNAVKRYSGKDGIHKAGELVVQMVDGEPYYVSATALTNGKNVYEHANYVDASTIPYIVFPESVITTKNHSGYPILPGDIGLAYDTKTKKMCFAIFGDVAGTDGGGEASVKLADELGLANAAKNGRGGGTDAKRILYVAFGRSGNRRGKTYEEIKAKGAQLLEQYGGQAFIDRLLELDKA